MTIKNLAAAAFAAAALITVPASLGTSFTGTAPANGITAEAASYDVVAQGCYVKSLAAQNANAVVAEGLVYELDNDTNTATLAGRWSNASMVIMPDVIRYQGKDYKITSIAPNSFRNTSGPYAIKEFKAGRYLESIGNEAFMNSPVRNIELNSELRSIGAHAFDGCMLTTVFIDASTKQTPFSIGDSAFANNASLRSVTNWRKNITIAATAFQREDGYSMDEHDSNFFFASGLKRDYIEGIVFGN